MRYKRRFAVVTGAQASDLHSVLDAILQIYEGTEFKLKESHFNHCETTGTYDLLFVFEKEIAEDEERNS